MRFLPCHAGVGANFRKLTPHHKVDQQKGEVKNLLRVAEEPVLALREISL